MHWFTEANFSKLFNMSQMTVEYLLYVQEHLHSRNVSLEALLAESEQHAAAMQARLREQADYVGALEQQLRNTRAGIAGTDGRPTETCPSCQKTFLNIDYLHAHMRRRHPGVPLPPASAPVCPPAAPAPAPAPAMVDSWGGAAFTPAAFTAPPGTGGTAAYTAAPAMGDPNPNPNPSPNPNPNLTLTLTFTILCAGSAFARFRSGREGLVTRTCLLF